MALPLLFILSFKPKYKESIPARFFLFKNQRFTLQDSIWFHVCSLGEARALKPLLEELKDEKIVITTITHTGYEEAKKYKAEVRYLPYELFLPFWIKKQKILVVLEAEFWYMLFLVAFNRGSEVILLNARISERSAKRYLQFAWFYKKLFAYVSMIYVQSQEDKNRFLVLGAKHIEVIGNIKLAQKISQTKRYEKSRGETIVAASTHQDEEEMVLKAFKRYKKENDEARLIVVPRHPERFAGIHATIAAYAKEEGWGYTRFSQKSSLQGDVVLVDMIGELNNIYAISDIAVLGGAFREDVGGHNPLEPAHFGCKIITGKHFFHQKELFKYVHHVQYVEPDEIYQAFMACRDLPSSLVEEKIDLSSVIEHIAKK